MNEAWPLVILIMIALILSMIFTWMNTPTVYVDSITRECVSVVPKDAGSCEHLPKKYETVLVAPQWMREKGK